MSTAYITVTEHFHGFVKDNNSVAVFDNLDTAKEYLLLSLEENGCDGYIVETMINGKYIQKHILIEANGNDKWITS